MGWKSILLCEYALSKKESGKVYTVVEDLRRFSYNTKACFHASVRPITHLILTMHHHLLDQHAYDHIDQLFNYCSTEPVHKLKQF